MTNREKYKDQKEIVKKFIDFCNSKKGCIGCPIDSGIHLNIGIPPAVKCAYAWEELEYKEELMPCPFCGGDARVYKDLCHTDLSTTFYTVICTKCGARTHNNFLEDAIKKWNRRTEK